MNKALSAADTAAAINRTTDWFYANWPRLVKDHGFPVPIMGERPYAWDPTHVEAWLDRDLPDELRARVAQLRGAPPPRQQSDDQKWAAELDRRFGNGRAA